MTMERVREIIAEAGYGVMATSVEGQPRVRPMVFVVREGLVLWSSTYRMSGKVKEWTENPRVEVCFVDGSRNQVRIEGEVDLTGGADEKRALLEVNPKVRNHFPSEDDPKFVHVAVRPTRIRWKPPGFSDYREVEG